MKRRAPSPEDPAEEAPSADFDPTATEIGVAPAFDPEGHDLDDAPTKLIQLADRPSEDIDTDADAVPVPQPEIRMISMKTPAAGQETVKPARELPDVKLRSLNELKPKAVREVHGRIAPPRDEKEVRARRLRDLVMWGSLILIIASCVTLAIWLLAG